MGEETARLRRALERERRARREAEDIAERATSRLYHSLQQAEREHAALRSLASAATHDLKNPLAAIRGFADLLATGELSEEMREHLTERLRSTATYTETLFEGLLEALHAGVVESEPEAVEMDAVVADVAGALIARHPRATLRRDGPLGEVWLPPVDAHRLIDNLAENAARYAGVEDVQVVVEVVAEVLDEVTFRIGDNGVGVAPEDRDEIFRLFRRGGRQERGTGTGVGLAVSQRLAQAAGGDLWLDAHPAPGGGAAFMLQLPRPGAAAVSQA